MRENRPHAPASLVSCAGMFHTGGAGTRSAPCAPEARVQRPLLRACPAPAWSLRSCEGVFRM